jgi:hypothetical protein
MPGEALIDYIRSKFDFNYEFSSSESHLLSDCTRLFREFTGEPNLRLYIFEAFEDLD